MKYTITTLQVPGYPLKFTDFEKAFDEHVQKNESGKEMMQMFHVHTDKDTHTDFYTILWKLK